MKTIALFVFVTFAQYTLLAQEKIFQSDKLEKKWETHKTLETPESVLFDPVLKILFVSNINGKPTEKDGNGYISIVNLEGQITDQKWMTGLNAPKGMGIYKGTLYVTDIDRVAVIDIINREIKKFYEVPEAKFLNDIAIDRNGVVYVSDMASTRVYRIYNGKIELWLDQPLLTSPNGLFVDNDKLMIGCNKVILADIQDKEIKTWLEGTGGIDGLEGVGDGRYLFSDWSGNVYLVGTDRKIEKILDTTGAGINAADIEFIPEMRLLLVPTFGDNRVMAYELRN